MNNSKPVPEGYFTVTPYLIIKDAVSALDFYKRAFDATELMCIKDAVGKIRHAEVQIGDSPVMIVEEFPDYPEMPSPQTIGGSPAHIHLFVPDVDAMFNRAVANGATVVMPIAEQSEDRRGGIKDTFGGFQPESKTYHVRNYKSVLLQTASNLNAAHNKSLDVRAKQLLSYRVVC